jgi:hypothetical protein
MSCDFAVWFPSKRLTHAQAGALYSQLCEGNTAGVKTAPAVDAFYEEITAKHPELDDVPDDRIDDKDLCPWSVPFDRSPGHLIMSCVWSKASYVEDLVRELARKHGLAVFDPQSGTVIYPESPKAPSPPSGSPMRFW